MELSLSTVIGGSDHPHSVLDHDRWTRIKNIDLTRVKKKLMSKERTEPWTQERVDKAEEHYRRFLYMMHDSPDRVIVPTREIDEFWHTHILDTRAYQSDCENVFGYFLHHYPYMGEPEAGGDQALEDAFAETAEQYERIFLESYRNTQDGAPKCGRQCFGGGKKCVSGHGTV